MIFEWLPIELKIYIFQYLDIPLKKQSGKIRDTRVMIKSYTGLRLVSKNFYLAENTSRCRFCSGRYQYYQPNVTKCYCCGHVMNSKNFTKSFKKTLFKNRVNILGIIGVNEKLNCQYGKIRKNLNLDNIENRDKIS